MFFKININCFTNNNQSFVSILLYIQIYKRLKESMKYDETSTIFLDYLPQNLKLSWYSMVKIKISVIDILKIKEEHDMYDYLKH